MRVFVLFYTIHSSWHQNNNSMAGVFSSSKEVMKAINNYKQKMKAIKDYKEKSLSDYSRCSLLKFVVFSCEVDGVGRDKVYSEYHYFYPDGDSESGGFGKVEHPIK